MPCSAQPPFILQSVINIAEVGDLQTFARIVSLQCGPGKIDKLVPAPSSPALYAVTSGLPRFSRWMASSGILDRQSPPYVAHDFALAMRKHGKLIELIDLPGAGHVFDFVTPGASAWARVRDSIEVGLARSAAAK